MINKGKSIKINNMELDSKIPKELILIVKNKLLLLKTILIENKTTIKMSILNIHMPIKIIMTLNKLTIFKLNPML